jgi:hypothetical protein
LLIAPFQRSGCAGIAREVSNLKAEIGSDIGDNEEEWERLIALSGNIYEVV